LAGHDGTVKLYTSLDKTGAVQGLKSLDKDVEKLTSQFERQTASIKKQGIALEDMRRKLKAITGGDKQVASLTAMEAQLKRINKDVEKQQVAYDAIITKIKEVTLNLEFAKGLGNTEDIYTFKRALETLDEDSYIAATSLENTRDKATELGQKINEIKLAPENSAEAQVLSEKIALAENNLESARSKAEQLGQSLQNALEESPNTDNNAINTVRNLGISSNIAAKRVKKLGKETRKSGKLAKKASSGFAALLKRIKALVVAAFIFNVLRRALAEMVKYFGNLLMANEKFAKSWNNIRVNMLTAFAPIWETVQPRIISFMHTVEKASQAIAKFVAMAFGKTYGQAKDAAESLNEQATAIKNVGNESKESSKQLAKFDNINQMTANDLNEDEEKLDFGSEQDLSWLDKYNELFEKILAVIQAILDVFRKAWAVEGPATIEAFKRILNSLWELIKEIAKTWFEVWTGGHGQAAVEAILKGFQMLFHTIADIADAFLIAWRNGDLGKKLIESQFEAFTETLNLLYSIGAAWREVWNDGTGVKIATNILEIMTNINLIQKEFVMRIREGWESNENGIRIWRVLLGLLNDILSGINFITGETVKWLQALNLSPALSAIATLGESFRTLAGVIGDALGWAYTNILQPLLKWLLEIGVPKTLENLAATFDVLTATIEALKPLALWIWEKWLKPLAKWAGDAFVKNMDNANKQLTNVSDWIKKNEQFVQGMTVTIGAFFAAWKVKQMLEFIATSAKVILSLADQALKWVLTTGLKVKDTAALVAHKVATVAATAATWLFNAAMAVLTSPITLVVLAIAAVIAIIVLLVKNWDTVKAVAIKTWDSIKTVWGKVSDWFNRTVVQPLKNAMKSLGNFFIDIWNGIVNGFENMINTLISGINTFLNAIQKMLNAAKDLLSKAGINVNFNVPNVNPVKFARIPRLATGTVVPPGRPFLAELGDNNREHEIVSPLSTMKQAVREVLAEMQGMGSNTQEVVLELDGIRFARATVPYMRDEEQRIGVKMSKN